MSTDPKVQTQLNPPYDDGGDQDSGEKVSGELVVAGCDAAEVLDATEHAFDEISLSSSPPSSYGGLIESGTLECVSRRRSEQ